MIIGYILLFIQMNQVVLYADDFSLGIYAKPDAQINIFQYFIEHYTTWGGGYTGILVILILKLGFNVWKILNTLLIALMIGLGTKMITYKSDNEKNKCIVAIIMWFAIFFLEYIQRRKRYIGLMAVLHMYFQLLKCLYLYMLYTQN